MNGNYLNLALNASRRELISKTLYCLPYFLLEKVKWYLRDWRK